MTKDATPSGNLLNLHGRATFLRWSDLRTAFKPEVWPAMKQEMARLLIQEANQIQRCRIYLTTPKVYRQFCLFLEQADPKSDLIREFNHNSLYDNVTEVRSVRTGYVLIRNSRVVQFFTLCVL